jgi:hypothetical protein
MTPRAVAAYVISSSLKIAIGPKSSPTVAESNWLPTPDGKPFSLTYRAYVQKEVVQAANGHRPPS